MMVKILNNALISIVLKIIPFVNTIVVTHRNSWYIWYTKKNSCCCVCYIQVNIRILCSNFVLSYLFDPPLLYKIFIIIILMRMHKKLMICCIWKLYDNNDHYSILVRQFRFIIHLYCSLMTNIVESAKLCWGRKV